MLRWPCRIQLAAETGSEEDDMLWKGSFRRLAGASGVVSTVAVLLLGAGAERPHTRTLAEPGDLPAGVSVEGNYSFKFGMLPDGTNPLPAEVQSTVVPPGINPNCPQGRLLINNDGAKNPGQIALVDLDYLEVQGPATANIALPPGWTEPPAPDDTRRVQSNDQEIITLPDGVVLLLKMGQTRAPLKSEPDWFSTTYKVPKNNAGVYQFGDAWGPGARSEIFVWSSRDCGRNFAFLSGIDTALLDDEYGTPQDGSGGLPNPIEGMPLGPYQMGGTDGPLARVDPVTGDVFVSIQLVGTRPATTSPFTLSGTKLNRTVVMMSTDKGQTWSRAAADRFTGWRMSMVRRPSNFLSLGSLGNVIKNGVKLQDVAFIHPGEPVGFIPDPVIPSVAIPAPEPYGWDTGICEHVLLADSSCAALGSKFIRMALTTRVLMTRSASSENLLLSYKDTFGGGKGDGYRLYGYDDGIWVNLPPIAPAVQTHPAQIFHNYVFHVTSVDAGRGPLFFYWYDVDIGFSQFTMRGRLVTQDWQYTGDFAVSRDSNLAPRSVDVNSPRSYGDYHTAGAYFAPAAPGLSTGTYHYFPVWIEPGDKIHFAHVTYTVGLPAPSPTDEVEGHYVVRPNDRTLVRDVIDVSRIAGVASGQEEEETRPVRQ
jgi:hypothetical protein